MAVDSPLITRTRVFAAKAEATTGTAISLTGSDGVFNVMDPSIEEDSSVTERVGQGSLTNLQPVPGAMGGKYTFKTEVYNAASVPAWLSTLLIGCGWQLNTGVYTPLSTASTTLTLGAFQGGSRLKRIAGAMGSVTFEGTSGSPMTASWSFTGKWVPPSTLSIIAPTYPAVVPPRFAGATVTIGGVAYRISSCKIAVDNTVTLRQDVNDNANSLNTGYHSAVITGRKITVSVDPEATALASIDWDGLYAAGTTVAFSCAVGTGTNGIITFAAPALQLSSPPKDGDRNGIHTQNLEFIATSTTSDQEFSITPS